MYIAWKQVRPGFCNYETNLKCSRIEKGWLCYSVEEDRLWGRSSFERLYCHALVEDVFKIKVLSYWRIQTVCQEVVWAEDTCRVMIDQLEDRSWRLRVYRGDGGRDDYQLLGGLNIKIHLASRRIVWWNKRVVWGLEVSFQQ